MKKRSSGYEMRRFPMIPADMDVGPGVRRTPAGPRRVLDAADPQVGNSVIVPAQQQMTDQPLELPILLLKASPQKGEMVTISFAQVANGVNAETLPGPNVGIIEYGNSGGGNRIEVDIPCPRQTPRPPSFVNLPLYGAVSVTVPASTINIKARNDGNTPMIAVTPATPIGVLPTASARIAAWASYGTKPSTTNSVDVTRTVVLVSGGFGPGWQVGDPDAQVGIPQYAKRVWFPRTDNTSGFIVQFVSSQVDTYVRSVIVAPGNEGPLNIYPHEDTMIITITDATVFSASLVFELEV